MLPEILTLTRLVLANTNTIQPEYLNIIENRLLQRRALEYPLCDILNTANISATQFMTEHHENSQLSNVQQIVQDDHQFSPTDIPLGVRINIDDLNDHWSNERLGFLDFKQAYVKGPKELAICR
jgi:hypothetical protein